PVSAGWLVSRIWNAAPAEQSMRYEQALFASRWLAGADGSQAAAAATLLRGYARYPQLLRVLDRMGVDDVARLAALVLLDHMRLLGAIDRDELDRALDALAAPDQPSASRGTRVRALLAGLGVG